MEKDVLIANTKRALLKEVKSKLSKIFTGIKTPALPLAANQNSKNGIVGVRFDVFDVNYVDGAIVYGVTRWGDLIYSFPGDPVIVDKNRVCNLQAMQHVYHDLTAEDLYIEGIACLLGELDRSYPVA